MDFDGDFAREGFCYIKLFAAVNRSYHTPPFDLNLVANYLGPYPLVSRVIRILVNSVYQDVYVPMIVVSLSSVLHVDSYVYVKLSELSTAYLFSDLLIGGTQYPYTRDDPELAKAISLAEGDKYLAQLARNSSLPLAEIQSRLVAQQLMNVDVDKLANQFVRNEAKKLVVIHQCLDQKDRVRLAESFPEFQIAFKCDAVTPHPLTAACRKLTSALLLHKLDYNNHSNQGFDIIDIGANWADHALAGNHNIHCCSPIIDYRDSCRHSERMMRLTQSTLDPRIVDSYLNPCNYPNRLRCNNLAENCYVKARKAMSLHSLYDITEEQLTQIFDAHGIVTMFAAVHFHPSILVKDFGVLDNGGSFRKRKEVIDGKETMKIDFFFLGESTHAYTHDYKNYINWMYKTVFVTKEGSVIIKEIVDDVRPGIVIMKFVRSVVTPMTNKLSIQQQFWHGFSNNVVYVRTYRLNKRWFTPTGKDTALSIDMKYVAVSSKFYNQLRSYCNRSATNEFNISSVNSAASSYNNRITINGNDIYTDYSVTSEDLMLVATNIYMACYIEKYNTGQLVKLMTDQQKEKRESNSITFCAVLKYILGSVFPSTTIKDGRVCSEFKFPIISDMISALRQKLHDRKAETEFDLNIEEIGMVYETREMLTVIAREMSLDEADVIKSVHDNIAKNTEKRKAEASKIAQQLPCILNEHYGRLNKAKSSSTSTISTNSKKNKKSVANKNITKISDYLKSTNVQKFSSATGKLMKDMRMTDYTCPYIAAEPVKIPGDGKCCYNAILVALKLDIDVEIFKRLLYHFLETPDEIESLAKLLLTDSGPLRETWGNTDVYMLVSKLFHVKICFHCGETTSLALSTCDDNESQCVHIVFADSHFDALVTSETSIDCSVKKLLQLVALASKKINNNARKRYNPYSEISQQKIKGFNRSAFKLVEILLKYDFNFKKILDVGGAPGGFVKVMNLLGYTGTTVSDPDGVPYDIDLGDWTVKSEKFQDFEGNNDNTFIMCDLFNNDCFENYDIDVVLKCQSLLTINGSMFVKIPIYDIHRLPELYFEKVEVYKPTYSPPASCEIYLICLNKTDKVHLPLEADYTAVLAGAMDYIRAVHDPSFDKRISEVTMKSEFDEKLWRLFSSHKKCTGGACDVEPTDTVKPNVDEMIEACDEAISLEESTVGSVTDTTVIKVTESVATGTTVVPIATEPKQTVSINGHTIYLFRDYFGRLLELLLRRNVISDRMYNLTHRNVKTVCKAIEAGKPDSQLYFELEKLNDYLSRKRHRADSSHICDYFDDKRRLIRLVKSCVSDDIDEKNLRKFNYEVRLMLIPSVEKQTKTYKVKCERLGIISKLSNHFKAEVPPEDLNKRTESIRAYGLYGTVTHISGGVTQKKPYVVTHNVVEKHSRNYKRSAIVGVRDIATSTDGVESVEDVTIGMTNVKIRKSVKVKDVGTTTVCSIPVVENEESLPNESDENNVIPTCDTVLGEDIDISYDEMPEFLEKLIIENSKVQPKPPRLLSKTVFGDDQWLLLFCASNSTEISKKYFRNIDIMRSNAVWFHFCVYFLIYKKKVIMVYDGDFDSSANNIYSAVSVVLAKVSTGLSVAVDEPALQYHTALVRLIDVGVKISPCYTDKSYEVATLLVNSSLATTAKKKEEDIKVASQAVVTFPKVDEQVVSYMRAPPYIPGETRDKMFKNAAIEYVHLNSILDEAYDTEYKELFAKFLTGKSLSPASYESIIENGNALYNTTVNKIVYGTIFKQFDYGHDGTGFVKYDPEIQSFNTKSEWVLITKNTEKMLNRPTYNACKKIKVMDELPSNIEFINGAPGCGKTTMILESVRFAKKASLPPIDLLLTTTRAGSAEIRERLKSKVDKDVLKRDVKTITSYLINAKNLKYDVMYIDEVLITHAGAVALAISKANPNKIVMLGDKNQIPYIDRDRYFPQLYSDVFRFCDVTIERNVTHRCPIDVTAVLSDIYPGLKTTSKIERSLRVMMNDNNIPYENKVLYMTWTQDDKQQLLDKRYNVNGSQVMTIHEAQGQTFDRVIMVRRQVKALTLFTSINHAIVAFSRHKLSLVYYTAAKDALSEFMNKSLRLEPVHFEMVKQTEFKKLTGGWIPPEIAPAFVYEENVHSNRDFLVPLTVDRHATMVPFNYGGGISASQHYTTPVIESRDVNPAFLQEVYDTAFPGCSYEICDYQEIIENSDLMLNVDKVRLNPVCAELYEKKKKFLSLVPVIKTMQPALRNPTQRESLIAFIKRNGNAPLLCSEKPPKEMGRLIFENFVRSAIDQEKYNDFLNYSRDTISVNENSIENWLRTQPPGTADNLSTEEPIDTRKYNEFSFMIKRSVKPPLEASAINSYAALQTIAYNNKDCNMVFCPVINTIRDRLISVLKEKIILNTCMSNEEMDNHISNVMEGLCMDFFHKIENDFAKYDKSQLEMVYWFEYFLYRALGMDPYLLEIYMNAHRRSKYFDSKHGLSATIEFQRRSGGSTTWLGNTLFALGILLCVYDIDEIVLLLAGGDDSFILSSRNQIDRSGILTDLFNVEAKLLNYRYPYFCSKFLIEEQGRFFLIPDPIKFITKLGRKDIRNYQHLEEYRISCQDNYSVYSNEAIYTQLSAAVCERYKMRYNSLDVAFKTIYSLVNSSEAFAKLFNMPEGLINERSTVFNLEKKWTASCLSKDLSGCYRLFLGSYKPVNITPLKEGDLNSIESREFSVKQNSFVIYAPPGSGKTRFIESLDDCAKEYVVDTDYCLDLPDYCVIITNRFEIMKNAKRCLAILPSKKIFDERLKKKKKFLAKICIAMLMNT